jgi:hypothetical protein
MNSVPTFHLPSVFDQVLVTKYRFLPLVASAWTSADEAVSGTEKNTLSDQPSLESKTTIFVFASNLAPSTQTSTLESLGRCDLG